MPHDSDVHLTSHDRHDTMLVAALAAGDLAATDRDQAIALTASCADCATLRDDLVAIARATATVPPPYAAPARDFRWTPADSARLRPAGWRRLVAAFSAPRLAAARPLGVAFTTLGLVGLLVGNVQLNVGSAASPTAAGGSASEAIRAADAGAQPAASSMPMPAPSMAAASSAPQMGPVSAPAASEGEAYVAPDAGTSSGPDTQGDPGDTTALGGKATSSDDARDLAAEGGPASVGTAAPDPLRPTNVLFVLAVVAGLGLLVISRLRARSRI